MGRKKSSQKMLHLSAPRKSRRLASLRAIKNKENKNPNIVEHAQPGCSTDTEKMSTEHIIEIQDSNIIAPTASVCSDQPEYSSRKSRGDLKNVPGTSPLTLTESEQDSPTFETEIPFDRTFTSSSSDDSSIKFGRRIIDVDHLFSQIFNNNLHKPFNCGLQQMEIISQLQCGLATKWKLKCKMCNLEQYLTSEPENLKTTAINDAAVFGCISTGNGFSQMEEFCSILNMPFMSQKSFEVSFERVSDKIHETAMTSMEEAAKEERDLAIEIGDVDKDGYPCITVIADGAWSKRSYGTNYNSASGVACIVGHRTSKLLYLGVRNKYCTICARSINQSTLSAPEHICYKNWKGPSTGMEADIIVQGFQESVNMYGLKYTKLVGDGDSSVYRKIVEARPYGQQVVEKIECCNHLLRNFFKRIREICDKKRSTSKNIIVPPRLRNVLKVNCKRLRAAITKAAQFRAAENNSFSEKINNLKGDLINAPSHIFGEHKNCSTIGYFNCQPQDTEENYIPEMIECGLYEDLLCVLHRLVHNSSSLLRNMDNNDAEHYNAVVCKFTGGKRINFSKRGQYKTRCESALISFNEKEKYHKKMHKAISGYSLRGTGKMFFLKKKRRRTLLKERTQHKRKKHFGAADSDYGLGQLEVVPDMNVATFNLKKEEYILQETENLKQIKKIEIDTRGQSNNPQWFQARINKITASTFGEIIKMRPLSAPKKVEAILYKKFSGNDSTRYGLEKEPFAINQFQQDFNKRVDSCGLFIHKEYFYLAASPDGITDDGLIEVKCPASCKDSAPIDAINNGIIKYASIINGNLKLNRRHNYFYQIQGQLNIAEKELCYFILWTPKGMLVEMIQRDTIFWETEMLPKLKTFYHQWLLPEIVDSRKNRGLQIRNEPFV